jgi:hypothetical protein
MSVYLSLSTDRQQRRQSATAQAERRQSAGAVQHKIIYRSPPAAGLRGRALLMAQSGLEELQHSAEFLEFLLATPEFATDVATKGIEHGFWCSCCQMYLLPKTVMY